MTSFRIWKRHSRYIAVLFLGVAAVSVIALVWMGVRLFQQDRALEAQRLEELREAAAARIIATLEKILSTEEQRLIEAQKLTNESMANFNPEVEDFLLVISDSGEVRVWPENALLYYPVMPPGHEASSLRYAEAERAEFQEKDYGRAINALRPLSRAKDPATRTGAQLRLARNLRKAGRIVEALDTYDKLAKSSERGISISGVPADLVARRARCVLLEELGNWEQLEIEALSLQADLIDRRWHLDRASYLYYNSQVGDWLGGKTKFDVIQQGLADVVIWVWQKWQAMGKLEQESSGRESFRLHNSSVAVLWRMSIDRLAAVVAGPRYQRSQWFDPTFGNPDFSDVRVALRDSDGSLAYGNEPTEEIPLTTRLSSTTGLP